MTNRERLQKKSKEADDKIDDHYGIPVFADEQDTEQTLKFFGLYNKPQKSPKESEPHINFVRTFLFGDSEDYDEDYDDEYDYIEEEIDLLHSKVEFLEKSFLASLNQPIIIQFPILNQDNINDDQGVLSLEEMRKKVIENLNRIKDNKENE